MLTFGLKACLFPCFCLLLKQDKNRVTFDPVTKNRCVTHVKICEYANFVSSLLAYLISAVASRFSNSILSRSRMLLQIACYCNVTLFSIARKF